MRNKIAYKCFFWRRDIGSKPFCSTAIRFNMSKCLRLLDQDFKLATTLKFFPFFKSHSIANLTVQNHVEVSCQIWPTKQVHPFLQRTGSHYPFSRSSAETRPLRLPALDRISSRCPDILRLAHFSMPAPMLRYVLP